MLPTVRMLSCLSTNRNRVCRQLMPFVLYCLLARCLSMRQHASHVSGDWAWSTGCFVNEENAWVSKHGHRSEEASTALPSLPMSPAKPWSVANSITSSSSMQCRHHLLLVACASEAAGHHELPLHFLRLHLRCQLKEGHRLLIHLHCKNTLPGQPSPSNQRHQTLST